MKIIIAAFPDAAAAQQGAQFLGSNGAPGKTSDVEILGYQDAGGDALKTLAGRGVPEERVQVYAEVMRRGAPLVIAKVSDENAQECADALDRMGSLDLAAAEQRWRGAGWNGYDSSMPFDANESERAALTQENTSQQDRGGALDVIEEQVHVGKRAVDRGGVRVRTYIVERPVHESVELREERVDVTHEPVDERISAEAADSTFREEEYVVTAQGEEAVVGKEARIVERIHVDKRVETRTENIEETERQQKVDVQPLDEPATRRNT